MTFKSIVEHLIEREARMALEKVLTKEGYLDFGKVEIGHKIKTSYGFTVEYKEFGAPLTYKIMGFISDDAFITLTYYRIGEGNVWYDIETGRKIN